MKKYVSLGVNDVPKYLYYVPLVCWAWNQFKINPIVFYCAEETGRLFGFICDFTIEHKINFQPAVVKPIQGYDTSTISQVSRLYWPCVTEENDCYGITSDVDMLPLNQNDWQYEGHRVLVIGRDLTDYHYPICYVGARNYIWRQFMKMVGNDYNSLIARDIRKQKNMWTLDQDILTEKLLAYGIMNIHHVNRGTDKRTGYPIGRVDRSHWTLDHRQFFDAHLPHDVLTNEKSFHQVMHLLHTIWPKEDWKWFLQYTKEFKKLL